MRHWITENGGFIHESLRITSPAPCGSSRGITAVQPITLDEMEASPLIVIPKSLHIDNIRAMAIIAVAMGMGSQVEIELVQVQLVALALSIERSKNAESQFYPYLASLPSSPPCPWYHVRPSDTDEAIGNMIERDVKHLQLDWIREKEKWIQAVRRSRQQYESLADEILNLLASTSSNNPLQLIEKDELLWSMAQVVSRSLGSGGASGLVPYCDLLNHSSTSRPPMLQLSDLCESYDKLVITVTNIKGDEVEAVREGEEIFISYGELETDTLRSYNKFGFAPHM